MVKPLKLATYHRNVDAIYATRVADWNLESLALWCGGRVDKDRDELQSISVPTLSGIAQASKGAWILHFLDTGRFEVWGNQKFTDQYHEALPPATHQPGMSDDA